MNYIVEYFYLHYKLGIRKSRIFGNWQVEWVFRNNPSVHGMAFAAFDNYDECVRFVISFQKKFEVRG